MRDNVGQFIVPQDWHQRYTNKKGLFTVIESKGAIPFIFHRIYNFEIDTRYKVPNV